MGVYRSRNVTKLKKKKPLGVNEDFWRSRGFSVQRGEKSVGQLPSILGEASL